MSKSIEEIMDSFDSTRCVWIEITNKSSSKKLTNPETYNASGRVHSPSPSIINPGQKGVCVFINTPHRDGDAVGVLSYHFGDTQVSLLVSNPSDQKKYIIESALYVTDKPTPTDYNLYNKMYKELPESASFIKTAVGKGNPSLNITKKSIHVHFLATMSHKQKVILKIDIRDA